MAKTTRRESDAADVRVQPGLEPVESVAATLANQSDAEATDAELETAAPEPPKRRRGRPPGSRNKSGSGARVHAVNNAPQEPTPEQLAAQFAAEADALAPMLHSIMRTFVDRRWPDAPYRIDEAGQLAAAIVPVGHKYGGVFGAYKEEFMLGIVIVAQFNGRQAPPTLEIVP